MADKLVNEEITKFILRTNFPNFISEESAFKNYQYRKYWEYYWVIDPIDGTKEFIKQGQDYTINIALAHRINLFFQWFMLLPEMNFSTQQ